MPATRAEAQAFVQQFNALHRTQAPGVRGVQSEDLMALVRETNADVVALAARSYLEVAFNPKLSDERNAMLQRAIMISGAYEAVHDDDSVSRMVQRKMKEEGVAVAPFMKPLDEVRADAPPPPILINVDAATLASGDPYPIVSALSFDAQPASKWQWLSTHRGRLVIGFDLPLDGPEVFERDDVRAFMTELLKRLPYLAYFLDTHAEWGMPRMMMFSLVDPEAIAGPGQLNLHHASAMGVVFALALGIRMACERTGEPFVETARERLSYLPPELVDDTLAALGIGDVSGHELDLRSIVAQVVHGRGTVEDAAIEIVRHADAYVARGEDADSRPVREVRARWYRLRDEIGTLLDGLTHVVSPMRVAHEGRLLVTAADLLSGDLAGAAAVVVAGRLGELDAKDGEVDFLSLALEKFPPLSPEAMHVMRTRVQRLGALHRDADAIDAATTYHDRAVEQASGGDQAEALLLRSLARMSDRQAGLALEDIRTAAALRTAAADVPTWVSPLSDYLVELGRQERGAGHVEAAFVAFDRGRRVARDDERDAARSVVHLSEIGITWEVVGDLERAAKVLDDAVREALAAGHPELAARWGGAVDPDAPEPSGAAAQLGQLARLLAAPSRDLDRIRRGTLELIRRSVEGGGRELEMQARNLLGRVYAAGGRWAQAEAALLEAAAMSEDLGLRLMTFHLWTNLGNLYLQWGRREPAEDALRRAAALGEVVREESQGTELRQSLGAGLARCYQQLAFWAHNTFVPSGSNAPQRPDPAAAFDVGTRARAHNFNAWLRTSLLLDGASDEVTRRAVERLREAEVALEAASHASSALPPDLIDRRQHAHDACRALGIDPVALARQPQEARSLSSWQRELAAGDLAVVLCSLPEGIGALVITSSAAECRYLPFPRNDRLRVLRELREACWNFVEHDDGDVPGPARQTARAAQAMVDHVHQRLEERVFAPVAALASGMGPVQRLLVVPHDELFLVPWARLQEMLGATRLSCLPSTEALTLLRSRERRGRQPWVAFGDATGELGGAAREVGALPDFHVDTATRKAVLDTLPGAGLAHFAGHGVHDAVNEYHTGLVLLDASAPNGEDVFTVADVSALVTMREAHLVVLSACDSGLPRVHPASEFTSLPGAFLVAGARNVVASLWPAHDVAASLFMRAFYDALVKDDVATGSVSSALATARRSLATMSYDEAVAISGDAEAIPRRPHPFDHPAYLDTFQHYGVD